MTVTFRLEAKAFDFDFSNPSSLFGLMNILYPFFSKLASITDAKIKFNELQFYEGFVQQDKLIDSIITNYWNQGIRQIFKILGSSDMIGNPAGLIDKVGSSFMELAREPYHGIRNGPGQFFAGIGIGVKGVIGGVIGGGF